MDCLHFQFAGLGHALGIYASPGTLAHLTAREAAGTEERAHRGDGRSHRHGAALGVGGGVTATGVLVLLRPQKG